MVKTMFRGTTIEIWEKDYVNREPWMAIDPKDLGAEIIQIEHAYDNYFMVEVKRQPKKPSEEDIINKILRENGILEEDE